MRIGDLTDDLAEAFEIEELKGALIEQVEPGFPADKAGIKRGDVITSIDGKVVESSSDLRLTVASISPGTRVKVQLIRKGKPKEIWVKLGNLDNPEANNLAAQQPLFEGITLKRINKEDYAAYRIDKEVKGLLITKVESNSVYAKVFRERMVLVEINDQSLQNVENPKKLLRKGINKLWVYYRGVFSYVAIRLR